VKTLQSAVWTRRHFLKAAGIALGLWGLDPHPARAAEGTLRRLETIGTPPPARANHTAVYDSVNHRMLIFGGRGDAGITNDLWALNLRDLSWQNLTPVSSPPPARFGHNAIFDHPRRRMIIYAGQFGSTFFNDTWAFDVNTNTWQDLSPRSERPEVRYGSIMVHDTREQRGVIFAGFTDQGRFDDTQAFRLVDATWKNLTPVEGPRPVKRCLHTGVYDSRGHRLVLFGGQSAGALGDTWYFDLSANTWREITPSTAPDKRFFAASVYDPSRHRLLLFGGTGAQRFDDLWALDLAGDQWSRLAVDGPKPTARHSHSAILIESERRVLLFGGNGPSSLNETWELKL
jgi:hypothetical protein